MVKNMESPVKAPLMIEPLMPGEVLTLPDGQTVHAEGILSFFTSLSAAVFTWKFSDLNYK